MSDSPPKPSVKMEFIEQKGAPIDISRWNLAIKDKIREVFDDIIDEALNEVVSVALKEEFYASLTHVHEPIDPKENPVEIYVSMPFGAGSFLSEPLWSFSFRKLVDENIHADGTYEELIALRDALIEITKSVQLKILREDRWHEIERGLDAEEKGER